MKRTSNKILDEKKTDLGFIIIFECKTTARKHPHNRFEKFDVRANEEISVRYTRGGGYWILLYNKVTNVDSKDVTSDDTVSQIPNRSSQNIAAFHIFDDEIVLDERSSQTGKLS